MTEAEFPCCHALLAATLALMTRYSLPDDTAAIDQQRLRPLIARKVVAHLSFLRRHPDLPPPLRCLANQLLGQWQAATDNPTQAAQAPSGPWHDRSTVDALRAPGVH